VVRVQPVPLTARRLAAPSPRRWPRVCSPGEIRANEKVREAYLGAEAAHA